MIQPGLATLRVPYETEGFPAGTVPNGVAHLAVSWDDILWAAVTVGRPNRQFVFQHGDSSAYEAIFRWSLVRMALEQRGLAGRRLWRTGAAMTLDPTEKGAVNYFLGMTFCKLFAAKCLNTPWLLHLDVFRPLLNAVLATRSRPDLVGRENGTGRWHAFECKGRISPPGEEVKSKAKSQARRLIAVDGNSCALHIGAITYFRNDSLRFFWRDPEPPQQIPIDFSLQPEFWRYYYSPLVQLIEGPERRDAVRQDSAPLVPIEGVDVEVGIHPSVAGLLFDGQWDAAQRAAVDAEAEILEGGYQPDGLLVRAGRTWRERFREPDVD